MQNKLLKCEILAPAGSYQSMLAAFNAGADAVYIGGNKFGARSFADNLSEEDLIKAINYAHLIDKSIYLTVNTLLKEKELTKELIEYISPLYEAGLDGIIVQDMGVLNVIHEHFPDLPIHCSTQMTVTGINFAKELKRLGVSRIVTARELSLKEIKNIYNETSLEIESFIHGALCYSYSGQCLFSSLIGGRSGNRGKCAQPCRMTYDLFKTSFSDKDKKINDFNQKYLLSPKDLCSIQDLSDILDAGIFSLKIEGRMKKPEYVASVTAFYRKYADKILMGTPKKISTNDIDQLKDIYNRGGFTDGFYKKQNSKEIMSLYKPNHYGLKVGEIFKVSKNQLHIKALSDIDSKDILEINLKNNSSENIKLDNTYKKGNSFIISHRSKSLNSIDDLYETGVFRTRNNNLIKDISQNYLDHDIKSEINGYIEIKKDKNIVFTVSNKDTFVTVTGNIPATASNRPATTDSIEKQLKKTGNSPFYFKNIEILLDDGLFLSITELNELRRLALSQLEEKIIKSYARTYIDKTSISMSKNIFPVSKREIECVINTKDQLFQVLQYNEINRIVFELSSFSYKELSEYIIKIKSEYPGKKIYIALPYICRTLAINDFSKNSQFFENPNINGFLIRNYEEYFYFKNKYKELSQVEWIFDSSVYCFNNRTISYIKDTGATSCTVPYELNSREIKELNTTGMRMELYGHTPVMTSAGCVKKTMDLCDNKSEDSYYIKDRLNNKFYIQNRCRYCYNQILNNKALMLLKNMSEIDALELSIISLRFTIESPEEISKILNSIKKDDYTDLNEGDYTKGHYKRGVL